MLVPTVVLSDLLQEWLLMGISITLSSYSLSGFTVLNPSNSFIWLTVLMSFLLLISFDPVNGTSTVLWYMQMIQEVNPSNCDKCFKALLVSYCGVFRGSDEYPRWHVLRLSVPFGEVFWAYVCWLSWLPLVVCFDILLAPSSGIYYYCLLVEKFAVHLFITTLVCVVFPSGVFSHDLFRYNFP